MNKRKKRSMKMAWANRFAQRILNLRGQKLNREGRKGPDKRQRIINAMTNWQLNQAGRTCKGKFSKLTDKQLLKFSKLQRRGAKI